MASEGFARHDKPKTFLLYVEDLKVPINEREGEALALAEIVSNLRYFPRLFSSTDRLLGDFSDEIDRHLKDHGLLTVHGARQANDVGAMSAIAIGLSRSMRRTVRITTAIALVVSMLFVVAPYAAAFRLAEAVEQGDVQHLERAVDWPGLRTNVSALLDAVIAAAPPPDTSASSPQARAMTEFLARTAMKLAKDYAIPALLTPQNFGVGIKMIRQIIEEKQAKSAKPRDVPTVAVQSTHVAPPVAVGDTVRDNNSSSTSSLWQQLTIRWTSTRERLAYVRYAFFTSLNEFQIDIAPPNAPIGDVLSINFRLSGYRWKLMSVDMPPSYYDSMARELRKRFAG